MTRKDIQKRAEARRQWIRQYSEHLDKINGLGSKEEEKEKEQKESLPVAPGQAI